MDRSYDAALKRREQLRQELEKVEQYIRLSHELFGEPKPDWIQSDLVFDSGQVDADHIVAANAIRSDGRIKQTAVRPDGYAKPAEVVRAAKEILLAKGRPMVRSDILREMEARGMIMPGADTAKSLGTTLWRAQETFVQLDGHGYWLKGQPNLLVGYDPRGNRERGLDVIPSTRF